MATHVGGVVLALLVFDFTFIGWSLALIPFFSGVAIVNTEKVKIEKPDTDSKLIRAYESDDEDEIFAVIKLRQWLRKYW